MSRLQALVIAIVIYCSVFVFADSQSPATYFIHPPDSGTGSLYGTDQIYHVGDVLNVTWTTNETYYGIWMWQQDPRTGLATEDSDTAIFEVTVKSSATSALWTVSPQMFSLDTSPIFFFNLGQYPSLTDNYATCHYFNISNIRSPVTSTTSTQITSTSSTASGRTPSTTASVATAPPNPERGGDTATKVGLGVGLGLGIPVVLILLGFLALKTRQMRKRSRPGPEPITAADEKTELPAYETEHTPQELHGRAIKSEGTISELEGGSSVANMDKPLPKLGEFGRSRGQEGQEQ